MRQRHKPHQRRIPFRGAAGKHNNPTRNSRTGGSRTGGSRGIGASRHAGGPRPLKQREIHPQNRGNSMLNARSNMLDRAIEPVTVRAG